VTRFTALALILAETAAPLVVMIIPRGMPLGGSVLVINAELHAQVVTRETLCGVAALGGSSHL